jgi:hypothetical protein
MVYERDVVIESIREFNRAVPFRPYEIKTAGGERYVVPHPDFISISPRGSFVVIIDDRDRPHHLNAFLIERASLLNGHRRPSRKRPRRKSKAPGAGTDVKWRGLILLQGCAE